MKPSMHWAVQPGDGNHVRDIVEQLQRLGAPVDARVFVNGRRALLDDPVEPGDRVELYPTRGTTSTEEARILAQRDGVVLAFKPAGLPTETTRLGEDSLVTALISELNGGRVHAATRLDVQVSGVVVCTLGRDAARRVHGWRDAGQLVRRYVGIASGVLAEDGIWDAPLAEGRDRGGRHRAVPRADGKAARTRYEIAERAPEACLLRLHPETGRMHQLRAHAAHAGHPLYGDGLYDGPRQLILASGEVQRITRIALHAEAVETPVLRAEAPLPQSMQDLWEALSGHAAGPISSPT